MKSLVIRVIRYRIVICACTFNFLPVGRLRIYSLGAYQIPKFAKICVEL
jgi:hypothetical protein